MLVDRFVAVTLEAVDLPALKYAGIAKLLHGAVAPSAGTEDNCAEDGTGDPDAVACLRVSRSTIASLQGLDGFRNLLALAVPRNGLNNLDSQVRCSALLKSSQLC